MSIRDDSIAEIARRLEKDAPEGQEASYQKVAATVYDVLLAVSDGICERIKPDHKLIEDLGFDDENGFDGVEIVITLEQRLKITVPTDLDDKLFSVADLTKACYTLSLEDPYSLIRFSHKL